MGTKRNFECPLTEQPCINEQCRRDRCVDRLEAEAPDKIAAGVKLMERQRLKELYEEVGVETPPGKLIPPKNSN